MVQLGSSRLLWQSASIDLSLTAENSISHKSIGRVLSYITCVVRPQSKQVLLTAAAVLDWTNCRSWPGWTADDDVIVI